MVLKKKKKCENPTRIYSTFLYFVLKLVQSSQFFSQQIFAFYPEMIFTINVNKNI